MKKVEFQITFSEDWHTVSIATKDTQYDYLNRVFEGKYAEYNYLRIISWIIEISRLINSEGNVALFINEVDWYVKNNS